MGDSEIQRLAAGLVLCTLLSLPALRLLRREGEERLVGAFFLASGIGFGARVAGAGLQDASAVLNGIGHVGLSIACIALYRFTRSVFRPTSAGARMAERVGILASVGTLAAVFATDGLVEERSASVLAANLARLASYAWSFGEALRYWALMRRRVAVGLADPVVANRFGLWSIWMGGLTCMLLGVLVLRLLGMFAPQDAASLARITPQILAVLRPTLASIALVSGVAVWFTFFPPRFYARRLERSAA